MCIADLLVIRSHPEAAGELIESIVRVRAVRVAVALARRFPNTDPLAFEIEWPSVAVYDPARRLGLRFGSRTVYVPLAVLDAGTTEAAEEFANEHAAFLDHVIAEIDALGREPVQKAPAPKKPPRRTWLGRVFGGQRS